MNNGLSRLKTLPGRTRAEDWNYVTVLSFNCSTEARGVRNRGCFSFRWRWNGGGGLQKWKVWDTRSGFWGSISNFAPEHCCTPITASVTSGSRPTVQAEAICFNHTQRGNTVHKNPPWQYSLFWVSFVHCPVVVHKGSSKCYPSIFLRTVCFACIAILNHEKGWCRWMGGWLR
jgi:hypothetical protein